MKRVLLTLSLLVPFGPAMADIPIGPALFPISACPSTVGITVAGVAGSAFGCTEELVINSANPGDPLTVRLIDGSSTHGYTYESDEDVLVGVLNNTTSSISSIHIRGSALLGDGTTVDSFGFDGDGISLFTGAPSDIFGYAGPNNSFDNISGDLSEGDVTFLTALAPGDTAYFSLEFPVVDGSVGGPPGGGGGQTGAPEPASIALLGAALLGLGAARRRR